MVEDIFAEAVALQPGGQQGRGRPVRPVDRDRQRPPAGLGGRAPRFLEGGEEGVAEEGVVRTGAGVPFGRVERGDAAGDAGDDRLARHFSVS